MRTRAGETSACTAVSGGWKTPAAKLVARLTMIANGRTGVTASRASPTPTAAIHAAARRNGSPMPLANQRMAHRPPRSTPTKVRAASAAPITPRPKGAT